MSGTSITTFNLPQSCSLIQPARVEDNDILFLASQSSLMGYDPKNNKQVFTTDVSEGCLSLAATAARDSVMVGGSYILQAYTPAGEQFMWTVASDDVITLETISDDASVPLVLVAAADYTLKLYRDIDLIQDIALPQMPVDMAPIGSGMVALALESGIVQLISVPSGDLLWESQLSGDIASVIGFNLQGGAVDHVVAGKRDGTLALLDINDGKQLTVYETGQDADLVDMMVADYRKSGKEILAGFADGTVIGIPPQESAVKSTDESDELAALIDQQHALQQSISSMQKTTTISRDVDRVSDLLKNPEPVTVNLTNDSDGVELVVTPNVPGTDILSVSISSTAKMPGPSVYVPRQAAGGNGLGGVGAPVRIPIPVQNCTLTVITNVAPRNGSLSVRSTSSIKVPGLPSARPAPASQTANLSRMAPGATITYPTVAQPADMARLLGNLLLPVDVSVAGIRAFTDVNGVQMAALRMGDDHVIIQLHSTKIVFALSSFTPLLIRTVSSITSARMLGVPVIALDASSREQMVALIDDVKSLQSRRNQLIADAAESAGSLKAVSVLAEDALLTKDFTSLANRHFEIRTEQRNLLAVHGVRSGHHSLLVARLKAVNDVIQAVLTIHAGDEQVRVTKALRGGLARVDGAAFVAAIESG